LSNLCTARRDGTKTVIEVLKAVGHTIRFSWAECGDTGTAWQSDMHLGIFISIILLWYDNQNYWTYYTFHNRIYSVKLIYLNIVYSVTIDYLVVI
jgi:hypothetical protein